MLINPQQYLFLRNQKPQAVNMTTLGHSNFFILKAIVMVVILTVESPLCAIQILTENSPPYQYLEKGKIKGPSVVMVKNILTCAEIKTPITMLPWKRAYKTSLIEKDTLLFSLARTQQREDAFIWITPTFASTAYLYKLKSRSDIKIESSKDLNGLSIGLFADDYKDKILRDLPNYKQFRIQYINNRHSQILMLINGRVDLTANDPETFHLLIQQYNLKDEDFEQLMPVGPPLILYLAINKNSDKQLISRLKNCAKNFE